jgi:hypothetical protein
MPRLIGWREWAALPELGIDRIKLKADTGARTSALHALAIRSIKRNNEEWVEFELAENAAPRQARVVDHRTIRDSGGHEETRVTVETLIAMGDDAWTVELTLTDREAMGYRMLLGRTAMQNRYYVDSNASYLLGKPPKVNAQAKQGPTQNQHTSKDAQSQEEE